MGGLNQVKMRLSKILCVHTGGGVPGLDDNHMVIGVGLRIMGNFFRIIRIIIKRVIGKLLDDKRQFLTMMSFYHSFVLMNKFLLS